MELKNQEFKKYDWILYRKKKALADIYTQLSFHGLTLYFFLASILASYGDSLVAPKYGGPLLALMVVPVYLLIFSFCVNSAGYGDLICENCNKPMYVSPDKSKWYIGVVHGKASRKKCVHCATTFSLQKSDTYTRLEVIKNWVLGFAVIVGTFSCYMISLSYDAPNSILYSSMYFLFSLAFSASIYFSDRQSFGES